MPAHVLIVESDLHLSLLLQYNLEAAGYEVEIVEDGEAAQERLAECKPDLMIIDRLLPRSSGLELCRRIRRMAGMERTPILMLTSRGETAERDFAARFGADDCIAIPFRIGDLLVRVRAMLEVPLAA